jgi:hypothetical protein
MNSLPSPDDSRIVSNARLDRLLYALVCATLSADAIRVILDVSAAPSQPVALVRADFVAIVAATCALIACGWIAARRDAAHGWLAFTIGAAVGFLFFARTFGLALADPTAIGWLLLEDWAQHYSGWAMFRHAPWHWPLGLMPEIWYPVGTAIVYTDSLPLLAFLLKPFSTWLPEPFQYIGLWLLLSFTLQGGVGALLVARFSQRPSIVLAGAALFVFAPVIFYRTGHDTLTAQWLLLAGLCLYFRRAPPRSLAAEAWPWWLLTAIAALVHPYLATMLIAIQAAAWWKRVRIDGTRTTKAAAAAFAASLLIAMSMWWLCGAMTIRVADSSGGVAFGRYSMNLLAFVNPMYLSGLLPSWRVLPGQSEGFAYLGAGMLALLALVLVNLVRERRVEGIGREWKPLAIVAFVLLVFATGALIAIGSWTLIDLSFKSRVLGAFRSSGRFVWIAYYALMLLAIVHVLRRYSPTIAASLLAAALIVQIVDLSAAHERAAVRRFKANVLDPTMRLDDPRWAELAAGRHHLTLLPPASCGKPVGSYVPMLLFAADHAMTFNSGYLARWDARATGQYCKTLQQELANGPWSTDDVYVIGPDWKQRFEKSAPTARCEKIDGYDACVVDAPQSPGS